MKKYTDVIAVIMVYLVEFPKMYLFANLDTIGILIFQINHFDISVVHGFKINQGLKILYVLFGKFMAFTPWEENILKPLRDIASI